MVTVSNSKNQQAIWNFITNLAVALVGIFLIYLVYYWFVTYSAPKTVAAVNMNTAGYNHFPPPPAYVVCPLVLPSGATCEICQINTCCCTNALTGQIIYHQLQ